MTFQLKICNFYLDVLLRTEINTVLRVYICLIVDLLGLLIIIEEIVKI